MPWKTEGKHLKETSNRSNLEYETTIHIETDIGTVLQSQAKDSCSRGMGATICFAFFHGELAAAFKPSRLLVAETSSGSH